MAELCRDCFIEIWHPSEEEINHIVMSGEDDLYFCEGCMGYGRYVKYIGDPCDDYKIPDYFQSSIREVLSDPDDPPF